MRYIGRHGTKRVSRAVLIGVNARGFYKGSPHGICTVEKDRVNADLLTFIKGTA